jgi:DNA-binding CsgD family transcriptional regulator
MSTTAMVVTDEERRIVEANATAAHVLDAPLDAIVGRRLDDFTGNDDDFDLDAYWTRLMREGTVSGSYPARTLGGSERPVLLAATSNVTPGRHMVVFTHQAEGPASDDRRSRSRAASLSPRERDVLRLVAEGLTDAQIAERLEVANDTARTHTRNALQKLGARTRAHAVALAMRSGELLVILPAVLLET